MTTVRDRAYETLRAYGVTTVFGNPGFTELPFLAGFPDDFTYHLGLQEAAVIGMADGFAQASGRPVLVNLHNAPGVGNALGNLKTAYRVICALGDGALLYSVQAIWTAVKTNARVVIIVLDNRGYVVLKESGDFLGVGHDQPGLDVSGVDHLALARGFGAEAHRIERADELVPAFEKAFAADGPCC